MKFVLVSCLVAVMLLNSSEAVDKCTLFVGHNAYIDDKTNQVLLNSTSKSASDCCDSCSTTPSCQLMVFDQKRNLCSLYRNSSDILYASANITVGLFPAILPL